MKVCVILVVVGIAMASAEYDRREAFPAGVWGAEERREASPGWDDWAAKERREASPGWDDWAAKERREASPGWDDWAAKERREASPGLQSP
ncbi:hypothetical protein C0Q70_12390 [Pomacea canaliculata]|uniref:Uncharacterized protein n=1 Tax=Pomacea canaliculata TaxID=400727 RepID=A0A2T7P1D9_POMCA|nr:hypothetical protein C0Q70_12390 [Pomacea canaliculata]